MKYCAGSVAGCAAATLASMMAVIRCSPGSCADPNGRLVVPESRVASLKSVEVSGGCELLSPGDAQTCTCPAEGVRCCAVYALAAHNQPLTCTAHIEFNDGCAPLDLDFHFGHYATLNGCYLDGDPKVVPAACSN